MQKQCLFLAKSCSINYYADNPYNIRVDQRSMTSHLLMEYQR